MQEVLQPLTEIKININKGKIKNLIDGLGDKKAVKVGLIAGKGGDDLVSEDMDLAGIGAVQEFGATIQVTDKMRAWLHYNGLHLKASTTTINIPVRSFLQMPLEDRKRLLNNIKKGLDFEDFIEYVEKTGDLQSLAVMIGAGAVETINEAFATDGFGNWQPNNPFTIERKKGKEKPLQNSGDLRRKITYEVIDNG